MKYSPINRPSAFSYPWKRRRAAQALQQRLQQAQDAAMAAVFGPHRHLDEGGYEIALPR